MIVFSGARNSHASETMGPWLQMVGIDCEIVLARDCQQRILGLAETIEMQPSESGDESGNPEAKKMTLVIINPFERFRDIRQEDAFSFSLDSNSLLTGAIPLQKLLRDGLK